MIPKRGVQATFTVRHENATKAMKRMSEHSALNAHNWDPSQSAIETVDSTGSLNVIHRVYMTVQAPLGDTHYFVFR